MASNEISADWTRDLERFLQSQPGITALRVNESDRTVSVATLGQVDAAALERQIAEVLVAIDQRLGPGGGARELQGRRF